MNQPAMGSPANATFARSYNGAEVLLCAPKTSAARKLLEELLGAQRGPKEELKNRELLGTMKNAMDFLVWRYLKMIKKHELYKCIDVTSSEFIGLDFVIWKRKITWIMFKRETNGAAKGWI